jgi:hypothetical protein
MWNGTSWSVQPTPNASGETFSVFNAVSCASTTSCITVGGFSTKPNTFQADTLFAQHWNGTSWMIKPTPPSPAGTTFATFTGVSCSATTACTAAGGFSTAAGDSFARAPLAERWNGSSWSIQTTPTPATEGFTGASCPASSSCTAVGSAFAEGWDGISWTAQPLPFLATGELELAGVSCSAANTCTAAGRSVQNYLIYQPFANSVFVDEMTIPLAARDPASSPAHAAGGGAPAGPRPKVTVIHG